MIEDSNPVPVNGERNIFCPHYCDCLDHASKNHWEYWACQDCPHKQETEPPNLLLMYRCHCKTMIRTTCCHRSFIKKQRSVGDDLETIARLLTADGMRQPT